MNTVCQLNRNGSLLQLAKIKTNIPGGTSGIVVGAATAKKEEAEQPG